jgi:IPT/TIG domain
MGDFSRSPRELLAESLSKGYIGLHVEQGVPVLDRDLNLLHDLVAAVARTIATRYIGSGIAAGHDGFGIQALAVDNDFQILADPSGGPGICLVDGLEAVIEAPLAYSAQPGLPVLTTPSATQPDPRIDVVFLDVWLTDVAGDVDPDLLNVADVGVQTSVRLRTAWAVRVAEDVDPPSPQGGHAHHPLARLTRRRDQPRITAAQITDLRQRRLTMADLEARMQQLERLRLLPAFDPPPRQFQPPFGAPGTTVQLFGRNFDLGTPTVKFGTVAATSVGEPTRTGVTAVVPTGGGPGTVQIRVETLGGTAVSDLFFDRRGEPPTITSFGPPKGQPGATVTITGTHFDENVDVDTTVQFDTVDAVVDSVTATTVKTRVPLGVVGSVDLSVTTQWGTATAADKFVVIGGVPS